MYHSEKFPNTGDHVTVKAHRYTDVNGRKVDEWTMEGIVEWIDGNGAWVKGSEKSRWIPIEEFQHTKNPEPENSPTDEN